MASLADPDWQILCMKSEKKGLHTDLTGLLLTRVAQYEKLSIHNITELQMQDFQQSSISSGRVLRLAPWEGA